MRRSAIFLFAFPVLGVGFLYAWVRLSSEIGGWERAPFDIPGEPAKHVVTPRMSESSRGMVFRQAPDFSKKANDGANYTLRELTRQGPVLLTFIEIGCPCSEAAQPFFNRLRAVYPQARILGVIDGELGPANLWASRISVLYPLLLDPDLELVRAYGIENSAYVVLIDEQGRIAMHWPGYSASMLQELGASLARLTRSALRPIDVSGAPSELYTGCPYDL
jgi:peroxiredoxin